MLAKEVPILEVATHIAEEGCQLTGRTPQEG